MDARLGSSTRDATEPRGTYPVGSLDKDALGFLPRISSLGG